MNYRPANANINKNNKTIGYKFHISNPERKQSYYFKVQRSSPDSNNWKKVSNHYYVKTNAGFRKLNFFPMEASQGNSENYFKVYY